MVAITGKMFSIRHAFVRKKDGTKEDMGDKVALAQLFGIGVDKMAENFMFCVEEVARLMYAWKTKQEQQKLQLGGRKLLFGSDWVPRDMSQKFINLDSTSLGNAIMFSVHWDIVLFTPLSCRLLSL